MTPTPPPVSDFLAFCAASARLDGEAGRERERGVPGPGRGPSRDLARRPPTSPPPRALEEGVLGGVAEGHGRQSWRQTCEVDADWCRADEEGHFLWPEPNVTLNSAQGVVLGPSQGGRTSN